nr:FtsK/SpoIIIE domain-containing protein [uncultured Psychroserpens sp.]
MVAGSTGSGKSNILRSLMLNSVLHHQADDSDKVGFALIEPHETLCKYMYENIPKERLKDVIYIDLSDPHLNHGYNLLKKTSDFKKPLVASAVLEALEKFGGSKDWGGKLSYIILNCLRALQDYDKATNLSDVLRILKDKSYRQDVVKSIKNEEVKNFFTQQFKDFNPKYDFIPVYNKFRFLIHDSLRKLFVENEDSIYLGDVINKSKILLINTAKSHIGADASRLVGSIFISQLASAGFNRSNDTKGKKRKQFRIYIDEAQTYASNGSSSITTILEELRKKDISVVLSFQGITSLSSEVRESIFTNIGNLLVLRSSADNAILYAKEMVKDVHPFTYKDFVMLPKYHMIVRIMNNGVCRPFTCTSVVYEDFHKGGIIS